MDLSLVYFNKEDYVETSSGNKVYKIAPGQELLTIGAQRIVLNGKNVIHKDVLIRGDLCDIRIGKFCILGQDTIIRPSHKSYSKGVTMFTVHVGDHVFIENDCVVSAAQLGSYVHVGTGSVLGKSCIIKECCRVLPNSVISPNSVFPPYSTIGGNPAKIVGQEPECTVDLMIEATKQYHENFVPSCNQGTMLA